MDGGFVAIIPFAMRCVSRMSDELPGCLTGLATSAGVVALLGRQGPG